MAKAVAAGKLKINGQLVGTIQGSVELNYGGERRTPIVADDKTSYSVTMVQSFVRCKLIHTSKTNIKMLNTLEEGLIEIIFNNGVTYKMTNATRSGEPITTTDSDGQVSFEAHADPIQP